jgi:hypothetical protein
VAAELSKLGFIAAPTSRSAAGADLLVTDQKCRRSFSVQVKTNSRSFGFWLVGNKVKEMASVNHIYVLVNIRKHKSGGETIEYFVVPSQKLSRRSGREGVWPSIFRKRILECQDDWSVFGRSS